MKIEFVLPSNRKHIKLGKVEPGTIVRFADSGKYSRNLLGAVAEPKENLFVVFKDEKQTKGHTDLVTLDGQHMFRRTNDRMVVIHGNLGQNLYRNGPPCSRPVRISEVQPGELISQSAEYDPKEGASLVAKGNPSPNEKIPVISTSGNKLLVDDDLLVYVFEDASINPLL